MTIQRLVRRQVVLPAFRCDIASYGQLLRDLAHHCGPEPTAHTLITVTLGGEEFNVDDIGEFISHPWRVDVLDDVSAGVWHGAHKYPGVTVVVGGLRRGGSSVRATSDSEAWNAGATEIALAFATRHRNWFPSAALIAGLPLVALAGAGGAAFMGTLPQPLASIAVFAVVGLMCFGLVNMGGSVIPRSKVIARVRERVGQRYATEIGIAISILALLIAIGTWLLPRVPKP